MAGDRLIVRAVLNGDEFAFTESIVTNNVG